MGRRKKAAKKVVKKKKMAVATQFKCLFCNHEGSVSCKMNTNIMIGELVCRICDAKFETHIHSLSDPIDVFSEWLDAADEQQQRIADGAAANTGFVGDGQDYVDSAPDDIGEEDDNEIVIDTSKAEDDDGLLDQLDAAETNKESQESSQVSSNDEGLKQTAENADDDDGDDDDLLTADSPKNVDIVDETQVDETQVQ